MKQPSFTLPQPCGGCNHDDNVIWLHPFSFTRAKLLFMAIRRLLFPEATVSQTRSYCFIAGLLCRAQTLSPTPTPTAPPPLFSVGSQSYYFYLKTYTRLQRETRQERGNERGRETRSETERSGRGKLWFFWSRDRCHQHVSALHVASEEEGAIDLIPHFNQKNSGFSSPDRPLYLHKLPGLHQMKSNMSSLRIFCFSCYAEEQKTRLCLWLLGHLWHW